MKTVPRRSFLLAPVMAAAPCVCKAAQRECCTVPAAPPSSLQIGPDAVTLNLRGIPELGRVGGYAKVVLGDTSEILVVHPEKDRYFALARKCTHGGGPLTYLHKQRVLHCTCWGHSQFAFDGSVVSGPAKTKLRSYPVTLNGGTLEIRLEKTA